jgi:hypothetical protein
MHLKRSFRGAREREPGIQKLRFDASKFRKGWIPGSSLRLAPE